MEGDDIVLDATFDTGVVDAFKLKKDDFLGKARFLLPKIQAFYQSEEGQRLFEEWINRRNAEEKTGKCKGS